MSAVHREQTTKLIYAPPPSNSNMLTSIYSIEIHENQEVEWLWLVLPDGSRVVTDYKIVNKQQN